MKLLQSFKARRFWKDFYIGVLFGCVILAIFGKARPWQGSIGFDFLNHYQASEILLNHKSPYVSWNLPTYYNYPPTTFLFIFWLAFFEKRQIFAVWQVFSIFSLLVSAILMTKIVQQNENKKVVSERSNLALLQGWTLLKRDNFRALLFFLAFLSFFPTRFGLLMGQINNFILLALCLFFYNFFILERVVNSRDCHSASLSVGRHGWRILAMTNRGFLEVSLLLATMLLVNRLTWQHCFVWLLPAFIFSSKYFVNKRKWISLSLLAFCFILLNHNFPQFQSMKSQALNWVCLSHGTWGLVLLWGVLVFHVTLSSLRESEESPYG